jgi:hypothetical protein
MGLTMASSDSDRPDESRMSSTLLLPLVFNQSPRLL